MPEAGDYIRKNEISIAELVSPTFKHVLERAEERVLEAIRSTKVSDKRVVNQDVEIMSFPVALMLVRSTNLNHLMDRYSLAEAIRVESLLKQENKEEIIEDIFHTFLGVQLEHQYCFEFSGLQNQSVRVREKGSEISQTRMEVSQQNRSGWKSVRLSRQT